jgi:hypothetical protein
MDSNAYFHAMRFIEGLDRRYIDNRGAGWVYVMRNQELKNPLLKIGMTSRPPHERASEMGSTSVPGQFELIYFVHVCEAREAERYAHERLGQFRYQSNKEFFAATIGQAVRALDEAAQIFPLLASQRNKGNRNPRSKPVPQAFATQIKACPHCGQKNRVRALAIPLGPTCGQCGKSMS